jgi:putative peptidoglycan lipid II flippase
MIFAPAVVTLIAPGFLDNPEKFSLTVLLTRIMFPFLFFISLASVAMGALNTRRVFFVPAVAPALLNISIITCVFIAAVRFEHPVMGAALGVSIGGLLQFLVQTPLMKRHGYSLRPIIDFKDPGLRKILRLVIPVTVAVSISQIYILVASIIASFLPEGSITYLFYSMRLIHFPIGVFGVAMGMAVLPSLSEHGRKGDFESVRDDFSFSLRLLFFITVPAMAGLIALREPIVNLLFQRGEWDTLATTKTAQALLFYSLGIWAIVGVRVMTSTFYSMQDTKTPVKVAVTGLLVNIILSLALMGPMLHNGLALAHALAATLNFSLLFYLLRKRLGGLRSREILGSFTRTIAASAVMAAPCAILLRGDLWQHGGSASLKAAMLGSTIAMAVVVYAFASMAVGSTEIRFVLQLLVKKFSTSKGNINDS